MAFNTQSVTTNKAAIVGAGELELLTVNGTSGSSGRRILTVKDEVATFAFAVTDDADVVQFGVVSDGVTIPKKLYDEGNNAGSTGQVLTRTATGVSWATASGGGGYTVTTQSTTYNPTVTSGTLIILCDTTSGGFIVTLPTAVGNTATIVVKKIAGTPALTVEGNGSETIDGGLTAVINRVDESITLISNNSNWLII